jgi:hypothetical protein
VIEVSSSTMRIVRLGLLMWGLFLLSANRQRDGPVERTGPSRSRGGESLVVAAVTAVAGVPAVVITAAA